MMMGGREAPTPEAAAYQAQRDVARDAQVHVWRRVAAALGIALMISVGSNVYSAVTTGVIRNTQLANTHINQCQVRTFDAILKDARLAFAGDKNAADYARAPESC
jgi:hypothetical protein